MKNGLVIGFARIVMVATLGTLTLAGCAVGAGAEPPPGDANDGDAAAANPQALTVSAAPAFSCSGLGCTCSGDWDCNNMFDWGACGNWPAKCYERGPGPVYCICAPWVRQQIAIGTTGGAIGSSGAILAR